MDNGDNSAEIHRLQEKRKDLAQLYFAFKGSAEDCWKNIYKEIIARGKDLHYVPPSAKRCDWYLDEADKCLDKIEAINLKLAALEQRSDNVIHLKRESRTLSRSRD
jgi:hypothetical protein